MGMFFGSMIFLLGLMFLIFSKKLSNWLVLSDSKGFWFGSYNARKNNGKWEVRQGAKMAEYMGEKKAQRFLIGMGIFLLILSLFVFFGII